MSNSFSSCLSLETKHKGKQDLDQQKLKLKSENLQKFLNEWLTRLHCF